jgi:class 3 adenylate cyclase
MEGAQMALVYAATYPDRVRSVVVLDGAACYLRHDDYPIGVPPRLVDRSTALMSRLGGARIDYVAPSLGDDERFRRWWQHFTMLCVSPTSFAHMYRHGMDFDIRAALPTVSAPTLVVHRSANRYMRVEFGRYLADHLSHCRYVELDGPDALFFAGDQDALLTEIETFLTGVSGASDPDRVLATILLTDIVGSTDHAARLGDARWREQLDRHDRLVADHVAAFRGKLVKTTGDGVLATFDGPARATRCAAAIAESVQRIGLDVRAGLHTGEVELRGDDVGGIAVHIAARVAGLAAPGEVLVSRTVRDLVVGSGLTFADRGEHRLKGVPDAWQIFAAG